jgi:hypothetical protein
MGLTSTKSGRLEVNCRQQRGPEKQEAFLQQGSRDQIVSLVYDVQQKKPSTSTIPCPRLQNFIDTALIIASKQ